MSDKQLIIEAVQRMSESASLDEISEAISILAAIRRGEASADAGRVLTHDEVKRRSATWITK
jgi:predicted transcriptional regulator